MLSCSTHPIRVMNHIPWRSRASAERGHMRLRKIFSNRNQSLASRIRLSSIKQGSGTGLYPAYSIACPPRCMSYVKRATICRKLRKGRRHCSGSSTYVPRPLSSTTRTSNRCRICTRPQACFPARRNTDVRS